MCVAFCSFSSCVFLLSAVLCLILFRSFVVVFLSFGFLSRLTSCEGLFFHIPRSFVSTCPVLPRRLLSLSAPQRFPLFESHLLPKAPSPSTPHLLFYLISLLFYPVKSVNPTPNDPPRATMAAPNPSFQRLHPSIPTLPYHLHLSL